MFEQFEFDSSSTITDKVNYFPNVKAKGYYNYNVFMVEVNFSSLIIITLILHILCIEINKSSYYYLFI